MFPNFVIAWVAKSWSSSLYDILINHSEIYFPWIKEINYFNTDFHKEVKKEDPWFYALLAKNTANHFDNWKVVWAWIIEEKKKYETLYSSNSKKITWDASIWYFHSKDAASNIFKNNPNTKILFLFRDPVRRWISHYWMLKWLWMTKKSVSQLLKEFEVGWLTYQEKVLFDSSYYQKNYKRYTDYFDKNNIMIVRTTDLKNSFEKIMQDIQIYLGVEYEELVSVKSNVTYYSDWIVSKIIKKIWKISSILPSRFYDSIKPLYNKIISFFAKWTKPVVPESEIKMLKKIYKNEYVFLNSL